jgi:hypothetical protein
VLNLPIAALSWPGAESGGAASAAVRRAVSGSRAAGPDQGGHLADAVPDCGTRLDAEFVHPPQHGEDPAELPLR